MKIRTRWWMILSGVALGAAAWLNWHLRHSTSPSTNEFINEQHMRAFLVRRRIDPESVESIIKFVSRTISEDDPSPLLSPEGATTASLFLNRNQNAPKIVWYVEFPRSVVTAWDDPETTVAEAFPFKHDALSDTDDIVERELLVHAVNPIRPRTDVSVGVASQGTTDSGSDRIVDVAFVSVWFDSGVPKCLADWFAGLARQFKAGELNLGPIETWSTEMIDKENMYTESIFLERSANGYELLSYMEVDEMQ